MIQFLVYSNLFIALAASLLTLGTFAISDFQTNYLGYIILVFAATLFDYNFHRIIKYKFGLGAKEKSKWTKKNYTIILFLSLIALIICILSIFYIPTKVFPYLALAGILTILYSIPFEHFNVGSLDIRKIPLLKNILIATSWTIITYIIPFQYSDAPLSTGITTGIIQRFIFILALTIPFDISDINEDKNQKFRTIPVLLGVKKAWLLANSLIIILTFWALIQNNSTTPIATTLTGAITVFIFNSNYLRKSKIYNAFWIDGIILLYGILLIAFNNSA